MFLTDMPPRRSKKDRSLAVALVGQSIMHLVSTCYHPPLHVALDAVVHLRSRSQFLIDTLNVLGVSVPAAETRKFERCYASQSSINEQCSTDIFC